MDQISYMHSTFVKENEIQGSINDVKLVVAVGLILGCNCRVFKCLNIPFPNQDGHSRPLTLALFFFRYKMPT